MTRPRPLTLALSIAVLALTIALVVQDLRHRRTVDDLIVAFARTTEGIVAEHEEAEARMMKLLRPRMEARGDIAMAW